MDIFDNDLFRQRVQEQEAIREHRHLHVSDPEALFTDTHTHTILHTHAHKVWVKKMPSHIIKMNSVSWGLFHVSISGT